MAEAPKTPPTAAERTQQARAQQANAPAYAVQRIARASIGSIATKPPFDGMWLHSTNVMPDIVRDGWKPDLIKNSIYGAGVYLARTKWDPNHTAVMECVLDLGDAEVLHEFDGRGQRGRTHDHVLWHLQERKVQCGRTASHGTSSQNQRIKKYFLDNGIRAIAFEEHGTEVVAVYDPSCIRVI
jgi:hypothetical protein